MIVVDVETTGTDPHKNSILSIGAVDMEKPEDTFYAECRAWDGAHIDAEALAVNGFTEEQAKDPQKSSETEITKAFFDWFAARNNQILGGQNPLFDLGFIKAASDRGHLENPLASRSIDQHSLAYAHMLGRRIEPPVMHKKSALNSDSIMAYVGIPPEPKPHIALNGALWEAEAMSRLLHKKNLLPRFKDFPIPF